jgi:hypothetical protein
VHDGKIYVAGGRPPRGSDFAVYDTRSDSWQVPPPLPTQRNHFTGAAINGRIHFAGGRQGDGLSPQMTTAHEVYDPQSGGWTTAAPMLRARGGMNGVMARGCFHVWAARGRPAYSPTMTTTILGPTNGYTSATCHSPFTASMGPPLWTV